MSFPGRAVQRAWHLVDASKQTVGRIATSVAPLLKGKHKPTYRPNADCGDYVVIINAEKVNFQKSFFPFKKWYNVLLHITRTCVLDIVVYFNRKHKTSHDCSVCMIPISRSILLVKNGKISCTDGTLVIQEV